MLAELVTFLTAWKDLFGIAVVLAVSFGSMRLLVAVLTRSWQRSTTTRDWD